MAFTTVVGGFEIAGTVGAYLGLGQNMVANNKNESSCLITTSLLQSTVNLLQAFDDLMKFADILTEDESRFMRQTCANVSVELRECRKIPLPKKKLKYFRKNPDYTKQLKRVQALAEASSELTVTVKETSSDAVLRDARRKKLEQEDRQAREARRNYIEDIEYYRRLQQFVSSNESLANMPVLKGGTF
ncbi:hypothetical protein H2248_004470 [Termitomyces sp. 'cryptogamus']|nr:hypothetical protein H2248_004470 [Termitomyces sp. 'cryptogamus']